MEDNINAACKFRYDSFEFGVPGFTGFYVSFLRRFCSPRTQELVLCDPGEEVQDLPFDTRAIFAHFNSVQRLEVHNGARATSIPNVLQFLRSRLESVERSDDELVMLPSLRKISLHDFDLSEGFDDLCVFLRHRKGRLVPVEVEILGAYNFHPDMLDGLSEGIGGITVYLNGNIEGATGTSSNLWISCLGF